MKWNFNSIEGIEERSTKNDFEDLIIFGNFSYKKFETLDNVLYIGNLL